MARDNKLVTCCGGGLNSALYLRRKGAANAADMQMCVCTGASMAYPQDMQPEGHSVPAHGRPGASPM